MLLCAAAAFGGPSTAFAQDPAPPAPARPVDPVAQALLASKPSTPSELVRSIRALVNLGHPAAAAPLAQQLIDQKLNDDALVALADEFGSAVFLRLARVPELNPAAAQFCTAVLDAAQRKTHDPARVAGLIDELKKATTPQERAGVVAKLRPAGSAAVAALVPVLADKARAGEHANICAALAALGSVAIEPLVAILDEDDPALVTQAVDVLGRSNDPSVVEYLLAPSLAPDSPPAVQAAGRRALARYLAPRPTPTQAAARLHERIQTGLQRIEQSRPPLVLVREPAMVWHWDAGQKRLVHENVTPAAADMAAAVKLAGDARRLRPDSPVIRRLYLATLAQAIALAGDEQAASGGSSHLDKARATLTALDVAELEDLLGFALDTNRPAAATVAARLLGAVGDASLLDSHSPQPSELARAAAHPDRRLRFAAVEAILKLRAERPYAGSSCVADALGYFARSSGAPRALVVASHATEADRVAGLLTTLGYEADTATDARVALRLAKTQGDYEFILADMATAGPVSGELLQRFRADYRSARIPVAIMAMGDELDAAQRRARRVPLCTAVLRAMDAATLQFDLSLLQQATGSGPASRDERRAQCAQALAWIAELAAHPQQIYDLRGLDESVLESLDEPELTMPAIAALARLDTPRSQRALVNLASRLAAPLALRRAAAAAFAESVSRYDTLLTGSEIARQYELYNASEALDVDTQRVLASILDTLEARAAADALALERPEFPPRKASN
ncbi:MAG: hypothetical protein HYX69_01635 [Planctomycetia bacterium]|nr:hypothetical protein [Planctomycetia bacterium]